MIADDGSYWATRRKVAPPAWLIATPTLIAPSTPRALIAPAPAPPPPPIPVPDPIVETRPLDTDWLPSRSFGGCTGWA